MENQQEQSSVTSFIDVPAERRKRIRRLIILIVLISVGVHLIFGVGAGIWVIARYFTRPQAQFTVQKTVNMQPEEREHQLQMEEVTSLRPKPVYNNRIQSLRPSKLALPELPTVPLDAITPIDTDALVSEQIDGMGKYGEGSGEGGGFFGGGGAAGSGLLEGTFYDLKRTPDGKDTDFAGPPVLFDPVRNPKYKQVVSRFTTSWLPATLDKFFKAPKKLYLTQFSIPVMEASEGPKAFEVDTPPGYWLAHYKGRVTAPEDGSFRFVGFGDNVLIVRWDGRNVLDASYDAMTGINRSNVIMYPKSKALGGGYGVGSPGHFVGRTFSVRKGQSYDIEVLIGESDGGAFACSLYLMDMKADYAKDEAGNPILPFFKQTASKMEETAADKLPPFASDAPIWTPASMRRAGVGGEL